jgi:N-methylhydantoinase A
VSGAGGPGGQGTSEGYRVGVDVGGTFTDLICITPDGEVILDKTPTTPDDQSQGVVTGLGQLAGSLGIELDAFCGALSAFVHGTTTADNTMIEMSGAPTGLLATEGHRDEIELRRDHKEEIWDPTYPPPEPIARRRARIPIPERLDFEGIELLPLDEEAVRRGVRRLKQLGITSIAVCFLFSFVNAEHELRAREIIAEEYPEVEHISLSHEVLPRAPEFERTSTTLVNAYVAPRISAYVERLVHRLRDAGFGGRVVLMQSSGGLMPPESVAKRAVSLLGSGPTGGVMAAALAAGRSGVRDFVAADMGGTSYDVCLVRDSQPAVTTDWNWRHRYYLNLPMVDIHSVGAGGGSIARVRQGALLVGPESAGSFPGPVCYGRGGERATVTDADAVLGYLPAKGFAGGRMELDVDAARRAIERDVAQPLGLDVDDAAWAIQRIVNSNMANAVRKVLSGHGADPRALSLIAYGGGGPVHAWAQARELGMRRVLVPKASPAFSALGLVVSDYVIDLMRAYVVKLADVDITRVRELAAELRAEAEAELAPARLAPEDEQSDLFAQMCYHGQNFDMSVPLPEGEALAEGQLLDVADRFHRLHASTRGFSFPAQQPLVRGIRLVHRGLTPKPPVLAHLGTVAKAEDARTGTRTVHLGEGHVEVPTYDGASFGPGAEIAGPALIEEPFTVVVLGPGDRARLDEHGNYDITVAR